ncbi:transposase [Nonomuraea sp. NPDC059007]|uniref:transposase n=1 Tax=Nonomuraea sp. NPDC059007 TaxID=3346692 RepID=UPI0036AE8B7E
MDRLPPDRGHPPAPGRAPLVWCWDNLNVHLTGQFTEFAAEHADWLRIVQLPAYAPELIPVEGVRSLPRRALANFAVADLPGPVRIVKRKLKKIQYRPHLLTGCLTQTELTLDTRQRHDRPYEFNLCNSSSGLPWIDRDDAAVRQQIRRRAWNGCGRSQPSYGSEGGTAAEAVTIADFGARRTGWGDRWQGLPPSGLATE